MNLENLKIPALLVPLLPLAGWIILGLWGKYLGRKTATSIAVSLTAGSFVLGLILFAGFRGVAEPTRYVFWRWMAGAELSVPFGLQVDSLSIVMVLTVSIVALLVQLYSSGCMSRDPAYPRFAAVSSLLTSFMLLLVLADNFLLMFAGWGGVSACTYMLVGSRHESKEAGRSAAKAFAVGRVADASLLIGLFLLGVSPLTLDPEGIGRSFTYEFIFANVQRMMGGDPAYISSLLPIITLITFLILIGAIGKSAVLPLSVWLPDSTRGPAPADALIQSAGSVTAGVYLIVRAHELFLLAPSTLATMAVLGALTALYGAAVGMVHTDIRKVLAYSTISQAGFMFLGCGVGAFWPAVFHAVTHACGKTCLILGAGSVACGTDDERDIRHLGGLKRWMPFTGAVFLIGTAAVSGFPFLSGFFSLNSILHQALYLPFAGAWARLAGILGYIAVLITPVMMYRLYYGIFQGDYLGPADVEPRESGALMKAVLGIAAVLSMVAGFIGLPVTGWNAIQAYLSSIFTHDVDLVLTFWDLHPLSSLPGIFMAIFTLMFIGGFLSARNNYLLRPESPRQLKARHLGMYRLLWDGFRLDHLYRTVFVKSGIWFCGLLWRWMDEEIIDRGIVEGAGRFSERVGLVASLFQTGYVRTYVMYVLLGIVLLIWLASL